MIAANRPVTAAMAAQVAGVFTEVIVAPGYDEDALEVLRERKEPADPAGGRGAARACGGGAPDQRRDAHAVPRPDRRPGRRPRELDAGLRTRADPATLADLAFAWRACRAAKSNAILLARDGAAVGIGMGQVNRVDSARLAVARAGAERARGSVGASDAFFPFPDGLEVLIEGGVRAVVQPGGSVRDAEVIAAAEAAGITMYLTGTRHFFH